MIDPKELMIGSSIQTINGYLINVNGINYEWEAMEHIIYDMGHVGFSVDELSPIPITPEWLERLGFELISDSIHIWNKPDESKDGYFSWSKGEGLSFSNYYHDYGAVIQFPHIKSVHQLQNLYHALTGQELTVKELTPTTT